MGEALIPSFPFQTTLSLWTEKVDKNECEQATGGSGGVGQMGKQK